MFEKLLNTPRKIGLLAIVSLLIPFWLTFFTILIIPIITTGIVFLFIKPSKKLIYELPASLLLISSVFGFIVSVLCLWELVNGGMW